MAPALFVLALDGSEWSLRRLGRFPPPFRITPPRTRMYVDLRARPCAVEEKTLVSLY